MTAVKVVLNITDALRAIDLLQQKAPTAICRALNRAGDSGRTLMTREVARDTGIRSKDVRNEIKVNRATPSNLRVEIYVTGKRLPLIAFAARGPEPSRGRGKGVTYRLPTGRGSNPHAFIATMKSGHRGIYKRVGTARLGITELHGPSLPHVFAKYLQAGQQRAQEQLNKNLQSEIRFAQMR